MSQCHLAAPTWTRLHTRLGWRAVRAGDLWGRVRGAPHPSLGFPWGLPSASILRGQKEKSVALNTLFCLFFT